MAGTATAASHARVAQVAARRAVHAALGWLHLHEPQILRWQTDLVAIPAPTFHEQARARWLLARFGELGLETSADEAGNAYGVLRGRGEGSLLLSAHLDTVFPPGIEIEPRIEGSRLYAPGACDNGAGIAGLLAVAASLRHSKIKPACDVVFVGNVGEEGEGDLRGMRHLYARPRWRGSLRAHIVLDGAGHEVVVTHALGSRRYLVTLQGPGGHAWTDAGRPNPIALLSRTIARLSQVEMSTSPRTTLNVGTIEGGSAINSVPESAAARFDLRSTDAAQLVALEVELYRAVEDAVLAGNRHVDRPEHRVRFSIEKIGDRPAGKLPEDASLLDALRAVDRHLMLRTEQRVASTDANLPISLGVEALSLGAGGEGGGIHTRAEWYDPRDRQTGLWRVLLLLLAVAE